eukprot:TRINITY_DN65845_c2_g7_i1.p1 TRINITY_DN65845_c2_g7~~TRINITY_DN65845_c2_g7_i1.p1  ORF type:complete len:194 (-),score=21.58 TRINITY_DN65845_c2_g7_i1:125-706(-)
MLQTYSPSELLKHQHKVKNPIIHKFAVLYGIEQYKKRKEPTATTGTQTRRLHNGRVNCYMAKEVKRIGYTLRKLSRLPRRYVSFFGEMARRCKTTYIEEAYTKTYEKTKGATVVPEPELKTLTAPKPIAIANVPTVLNPHAVPFTPAPAPTPSPSDTSEEYNSDEYYDDLNDLEYTNDYDPYDSEASFDICYD